MIHSNPGMEKELQQIYVRTEHWISDCGFFEDEIKFLVNLLDRFFIGAIMSDSDKVKTLKAKAKKLQELDKERDSITKENKALLLRVGRILINEEPYNPSGFREEYADIEREQVGFLKRYRETKKELFALASELQHSTK